MTDFSGRRYISVRECAEFLSLHLKTVYSLIARGKIPAVRVGRAVRVDLRRLEAQLEAQVTATERWRRR
jgi:excisionase family DNA binding protein